MDYTTNTDMFLLNLDRRSQALRELDEAAALVCADEDLRRAIGASRAAADHVRDRAERLGAPAKSILASMAEAVEAATYHLMTYVRIRSRERLALTEVGDIAEEILIDIDLANAGTGVLSW